MTDLLLYGYYYRYRELRKQCKNLVDSLLYSEAKTKLDSAVAEHTAKYGDTKTMKLSRPDFNYGERLMLEHAKAHLDVVIDKNDPSFLYQDGTTIGHHSDIVKEALQRVPKSDYSETVD